MKRALMAFTALSLFGIPLRAQVPVDRTRPPEPGPPPRVSLPPILTRQLPNGLKLLIVEQHELPLADFVLLVGSCGSVDPAGNNGVENVTVSLLLGGITASKSLESEVQVSFLRYILITTLCFY